MAVLKKGSKGSEVKKLQASLNKNKAKPPLAVDGIFGPKTLEAVKTFQKKAKLKPDGQVGELTSAAILFGGALPEMKLEDYKDTAARYKRVRAYNAELVAGWMRIRKIVDLLENELNSVIFEAARLSEANGGHWDKVFILSEEITAIQRDFDKLRVRDPKMAQKLADKCVTNKKEISSIGKSKISPNAKKTTEILRIVQKSANRALANIEVESKALKKNSADYVD